MRKIKITSLIFWILILCPLLCYLLLKPNYYETFFILIDVLTIGAIIIILNKKNRITSNLSLLTIFILMYFELPQLTSIFIDLRNLKLGVSFSDVSVISQYWVIKMELLLIILIFSLLLDKEKFVDNKNTSELHEIKLLSLVFMLIGIMFSLYKLYGIGGLHNIYSLDYRTFYSLFISENGFANAMCKIGIIGIVFYVYYFLYKQKQTRVKFMEVLIISLSFSLDIIIPFYGGSRNSAFLLLIMLFAVLIKKYNLNKHMLKVLLVCIVIYLVFSTYSDVRYYRGNGYGWKDSMALVRSNYTVEKVLPSNTEFGYAPAITYILIKNEDKGFYGRTLLEDILNAIPNSQIFKTEVPSTWFVKKYFPEVYDKGGGLGFSLLGEAYINFGCLLAFLFFVPIVFLIFLIDYKSSLKCFNELLAIAVLPNTILLLRSAFSRFFLEGIIVSLLIPYLIYVIIKMFLLLKKRKQYSDSISAHCI